MTKIGKTVRMPLSACLACGAPFDAATGIGAGKAPKVGSISICLRCGHLMAFAKDLTMRELTDAEMHAVAGNKTILEIQAARGKIFK